MSIARRTLLKTALFGAACPSIALAGNSKQEQRSIQFLNLHTGEKLSSTYWIQGEYITEEMNSINHLLRDFRANESTSMDRQLLDRLYAMQQLLDNDKAFHVISGYRSPTTNAKLAAQGRQVAKRSYHMTGQAIDIRLPGTELKHLHKAALSLNAGGVGKYERSNFVHIDTGRTRRWG
jgi:uncharacterized protein YcbK (DUF882 family)